MTLPEAQHKASIVASSSVAFTKSLFVGAITWNGVIDTLFYSALGATVGYFLPLLYKYFRKK